MRLWHKDLIPVLPEMQLRGQWRECVLIAKALHENNLNHVLVNRVKDYPTEHFFQYCGMVYREMSVRGYKADSSRLLQHTYIFKYIEAFRYQTVEYDDIFKDWHDKRYLRQCLYNLEEKAIAGGIPYQEWLKIVDKFGNEFDLWE
jgi:uncharacterized protein (TIGR02328 family)